VSVDGGGRDGTRGYGAQLEHSTAPSAAQAMFGCVLAAGVVQCMCARRGVAGGVVGMVLTTATRAAPGCCFGFCFGCARPRVVTQPARRGSVEYAAAHDRRRKSFASMVEEVDGFDLTADSSFLAFKEFCGLDFGDSGAGDDLTLTPTSTRGDTFAALQATSPIFQKGGRPMRPHTVAGDRKPVRPTGDPSRNGGIIAGGGTAIGERKRRRSSAAQMLVRAHATAEAGRPHAGV